MVKEAGLNQIIKTESNCRTLLYNKHIYADKAGNLKKRSCWQRLVHWMRSFSSSYVKKETEKTNQAVLKTLENIQTVHKKQGVWLFPKTTSKRLSIIQYRGFDELAKKVQSSLKTDTKGDKTAEKIYSLCKSITTWAQEQRKKRTEANRNSLNLQPGEKATSVEEGGVVVEMQEQNDPELHIPNYFSEKNITSTDKELGLEKRKDGRYYKI